MSINFLDRVAVSRRHPRPIFKAFRTKLVLNEDARQVFFPTTDKVLLAYDAANKRLAVKAVPPDSYEHPGWQAFHIEPLPAVPGAYQVEWRTFWDREVGLVGGRPIIHGAESVQSNGDGIITLSLS